MKNHGTPMLIILTLLVCSLTLSGQDILKEQVVDLTKKAVQGAPVKGAPAKVVVDDDNKQIDIYYTTKSKNKLIKFDVYQFDYDLNLISEFSEEQELEKAKNKYKWFANRYRGDEYTVTGLRLGGITMNKLELVETTHTYGWFSGKYKQKEKVLKEVKAKDLFGKPIYNPRLLHWTDAQTGNLIYINAVNNKKTLGPDKYVINRITPDLEKTVVQEFEVGYFQRLMGANAIAGGDGDGFAILADAGGKGVYKPKVNQSPTPARWTYLRFAQDGTLKEKIHFDTKILNWSISGATEKDGSVYIYGSGESNGAGTEHQKLMAAIGTGKQDAFQVVKVTNGNIDFVTAPKLSEINAAAVKPPEQKKTVDYNGRNVEIRGITITSNGDAFITAQDFSVGAGVRGAGGYQDLFMFHFAADGTFKRFYTVKSSQKKGGAQGLTDAATNPRQYPTNGTVFEGSNGKLYWMMEVVQDVYKYTEEDANFKTTWWIPLRNIRAGQIDIASGQIDKFDVLGDGKFFLYNDLDPIDINGGKQRIYLGTGGERGKQLWLGKFDPSVL